jgi:hypothetical protein
MIQREAAASGPVDQPRSRAVVGIFNDRIGDFLEIAFDEVATVFRLVWPFV